MGEWGGESAMKRMKRGKTMWKRRYEKIKLGEKAYVLGRPHKTLEPVEDGDDDDGCVCV